MAAQDSTSLASGLLSVLLPRRRGPKVRRWQAVVQQKPTRGAYLARELAQVGNLEPIAHLKAILKSQAGV